MMNPFLDAKIVDSVGKYAGPPGITLIITAALLYFVSKIPGTDEQKAKRALHIIWCYTILGVVAIILALVPKYLTRPIQRPIVQTINTGGTVTNNKTTGIGSPIVPENHGQITINSNVETNHESGVRHK